MKTCYNKIIKAPEPQSIGIIYPKAIPIFLCDGHYGFPRQLYMRGMGINFLEDLPVLEYTSQTLPKTSFQESMLELTNNYKELQTMICQANKCHAMKMN